MPHVDVLSETALDALNTSRQFSCSEERQENGQPIKKLLRCSRYRVSTHDHQHTIENFQPRKQIANPPDPWDKVGVSAHANTLDIVRFLQDELEHDGLDDQGKEYNSFVHYFGDYSDNAFWHPGYGVFVYGQRENTEDSEESILYYAAEMSIVAHEIFHGITHFMTGLERRKQSGALGESYSDIFGVLFINLREPDISHWNWVIGFSEEQMGSFPRRDLSNPRRFQQPDHMDNYNERKGLHFNNGIHNKAAFNLLTSKDSQGNYLFNVRSAASLFYDALCQLPPQADFSLSRQSLTLVASKTFQDDKTYKDVIYAINRAFDAVGIK